MTYYSRDLLKISLPKTFKDNNILADFIKKSEFIEVPQQRLYVKVGMQVTLVIDITTTDSMTGIQRILKGVKLTITGFRDDNECIVTKVQQGLHEGKHVEIKKRKTYALCGELGCAVQRLQFPIRPTPDNEIVFTAEDFIRFAGTGIRGELLCREMLQEVKNIHVLGFPLNDTDSPDHAKINEMNFVVMKGIYYQMLEIEYDEYNMILQFPFSGSERDITAYKKWVNVRMEQLCKSQREKTERLFRDEIQHQYKTNITSIWSEERIKQYKFREGGGSEWVLLHGLEYCSFRIRDIEGTICRYEDYTIESFKLAMATILEDDPYSGVWDYIPEQHGQGRFQKHTYYNQDIVRVKLLAEFTNAAFAEDLKRTAQVRLLLALPAEMYSRNRLKWRYSVTK